MSDTVRSTNLHHFLGIYATFLGGLRHFSWEFTPFGEKFTPIYTTWWPGAETSVNPRKLPACKDPKTKEVEDGLYLSQAISYQIHTRENKKTGAKERRIENQTSQGNFAVAIHKIKNGCFWGFIPDEMCAHPARRLRWFCLCFWGVSECRACYARLELLYCP